uniref:Uncharacterized protein n=1 Tax=Aegilops tauschii subsp. strangulata TaxID=200361 RepID=A0A453GR01_AEGTS
MVRSGEPMLAILRCFKFWISNGGPFTGLVHEDCITKMRLMSLLDLSGHCSGEIPYSAITKALEVIGLPCLPIVVHLI